MSRKSRRRRRNFWGVLLFILILVGCGAGGYYFWTQNIKAEPTCSEQQHLNIKVDLQEPVILKENITYKKTRQGNCIMDVAFSEERDYSPLLVIVHGGSWVGGTRSEFDHMLYSLSAVGYTVANLDYDVFQMQDFASGQFDSMYDQELSIDAGIQYLVKHAEEYHIDTDKIVLMGTSSAGQVCGNLTERNAGAPEEYEYRIAGLVLLSGATDLRYFLYNGAKIAATIPLTVAPFVFTGEMNSDVITELEKVDFYTNLNKEMPPVLLIHGDTDNRVPMSHSVKIYDALKTMGVPTELVIVKGMGHYVEDQPVGDAVYTFLLGYIDAV